MFLSSLPKASSKSLPVFFFLLLLAILSGCGTFEVGIESEDAPESLDLAEGTASQIETPQNQATQTPTPVRETTIQTTVEVTPEPNPLEVAFFWSGEMKGECQTLHINYGGEGAIGQCKTSAREWIPLDERFAHAYYYRYWLERFAPFDAQTPNGQVSLTGLGREEASPAWQRAMGIWGELVWVELETDGRSESWTTALDWRQQSAEQPDFCRSLQVSMYGTAQASIVPCQGGEVQAWVESWLDNGDWNQFDVWYYSRMPASEAELSFYGLGPLEMAEGDLEEVRRWADAVFNRLMLRDLLERGQQSDDLPLSPSPRPSTPDPQGTETPVTPTSDPGTGSSASTISWQERPPGLIYRTVDALWRIDVDEQARAIGDSQAVLSPDGSQLLTYDLDGQDLWLHDVAGGNPSRQLTSTPDRRECCPKWWPQRPDVIVFSSMSLDVEPQPGLMGALTVLSLESGAYQILDAQHDTGPTGFALSPDGQTVAYGGGETGWLYHMESGPEPFDPVDYGLSAPKSVQLGSPAWSPDGTKLAWMIGGGFGPSGDYRMAIGLFDLEARSVQLLHSYEPMGRGGWPEAPVWSPDGDWLAFAAGPVNLDEAGVWVVRVGDPAEEHYFGWGGTPVWSPDGRWLAYGHVSDDGVPGVAAVETGTWKQQTIILPPGSSYLVDWIDLGP